MAAKPREGVVVLISDAPEGQVPHYVFRTWGTEYGGRQYTPRPKGSAKMLMKKLIVLALENNRDMAGEYQPCQSVSP